MYETGNYKTSSKESKWTNCGTGVGDKARSKKFNGWSEEGYQRWNELNGLVASNRLQRVDDETRLLEEWKSKYDNNHKKRKASLLQKEKKKYFRLMICHLGLLKSLLGMKKDH